ncbi:DUF2721 domain-containing protein [Phormidium sp. CLA17]|uniref:DUF2721 domain-containing protein n=1 Tax=Leptolyngbya sp. Cla-17 TaxID=2803751 RepID=UPI001490953B|nr:DUF2721 domain-containing protein [Leptolyngbya sp. Cla-17]MBM0742790.1 DUF2721 domain-containing protein [Leptolyngbya sp. Cla-17]
MIFEMNAESVARTIQLIIAPAVLMSVCTLVQNGILARYTSVGDRMRKIDQERLEFLQKSTTETYWKERLNLLDQQVPVFVRRHGLLQKASLSIYIALLTLLLCMFAIALTVILNSNWMAIAVLALFLIGAGVLVTGVFFCALEVRISHIAICYELRRLSMWEEI